LRCRVAAAALCATALPRRRQAAADVPLLRCRHRRSLRATATALPPLLLTLLLTRHRLHAAADVALPPPSQPPRCRHLTAAVALCATAVLRAAATTAAATFTRSKLDSQWWEPNLFFRCRKSPKSSKFFLCIDNALQTVSVFESLVRLGDRESHCRNQASQLTVSAIDNERTGVINNN